MPSQALEEEEAEVKTAAEAEVKTAAEAEVKTAAEAENAYSWRLPLPYVAEVHFAQLVTAQLTEPRLALLMWKRVVGRAPAIHQALIIGD